MKRFISAITLPVSIGLVCVACFGVLALLESISDRRETKTNLFFHCYTIEPESMIEALNTGKVDVFSLVAEEPPSIPVEQQSAVLWTQDDYVRIVNALFQFTQNDDLANGWQLESMNFSSDCESFGEGFYDGNFHFFKVVKTDERESRIERIVNIDPLNKVVLITENEYSPILADWSGINLDKNLISASEALQIAEDNGGEEERLSANNACYVDLHFNYGVGWWEKDWWWDVWYRRSDKDLTMLLSLVINPHTGKIRP
jgi:hypothetical protein